MAKQTTSRVKFNPPLGRMPVLQFIPPSELAVDPTYQRSIESLESQNLIRSIAQHWNWDLCQPLVVSRRTGDAGETLYVIDGQHRLEAAKFRGDIPQLPCVVVAYANAADEAASFVHLNQRRRPLRKLDLFKAALASEDKEAVAIAEALRDNGLTLAPHENYTAWEPGMVANISGIERAWRRQGERATRAALRALAQSFSGQVLRYAGTIFPGLVAVCNDEITGNGTFVERDFDRFLTMLALRSQEFWRGEILQQHAETPGGYADSAAAAIRAAWSKSRGTPAPIGRPKPPLGSVPPPAPLPPFAGRQWCEQCDRQVSFAEAAACKSSFCKIKAAA